MPAGEYLLYRGLKCEILTTRLRFSASAQRGVVELTHSAFHAPLEEPIELVSVYPVEGDAKAAVLMRAGEDQPDAVKGCEVRSAKIEGWPSDALVVDNPAEAAAANPEDGLRSACGTMGFDESSVGYWRVFQGYAWYFNLGQDAFEIDPGSLTVLRKGADGSWEAVPEPAA
jgi:hypothetical protein